MMNKVEASIGDAEKYLKEQKRTSQSIERLEKSLKENNMNTGGPAFPHFGDDDVYNGMTLRDYFAAKAMNGILETAIDWFPTYKPPDEHSLSIFADLAQDSYAIADAMLKAREQ